MVRVVGAAGARVALGGVFDVATGQRRDHRAIAWGCGVAVAWRCVGLGTRGGGYGLACSAPPGLEPLSVDTPAPLRRPAQPRADPVFARLARYEPRRRRTSPVGVTANTIF